MSYATRPIISLFDRLGLTLEPWAELGFSCFAYDLSHKTEKVRDSITFVPWNADTDGPDVIIERHPNAYLVCGFPPCTDLAVSGARFWLTKEIASPGFQERAMDYVMMISYIGEKLKCLWWLENPVGAISKLWRPPNFIFEPYQYGGYLGIELHPLFPRNIPPQDAYTKKTCIWCSIDFVVPPKRPVEPIRVGKGWSPQQQELGGKNERTKEIRSATPRGFAKAVCLYNLPRN